MTLFFASIARSADSLDQENIAREKVAQAELLHKMDDHDNAEKKYFEAIKVGNTGWVWVKLAKFYSETEQYEKLLKVTDNISKKYPLLNGEIVAIHNNAIEQLKLEKNIENRQLEKYNLLVDLINKVHDSLRQGKAMDSSLFKEISNTSDNLKQLLIEGEKAPLKIPEGFAELEAMEKQNIARARELLDQKEIKLSQIATARVMACKALGTKLIAESSFQRQQITYSPQTISIEVCLANSSAK